MKRERVLLLVVLGSIIATPVIIVLACSVIVISIAGGLANSTPLAETYREITDTIMQAAIPDGGRPRSTSSLLDIQFALKSCGSFLPEALARNGNRYSIIIVGVWGGGASPKPWGTGASEAIVHVVFPDGTRVWMEYYQTTLDTCREIF